MMFDSLLHTLQIVAGDRQFYRDRLVSDANMYKEQISQLECEITTSEMLRKVDLLKSNLLVGMKQRDALIYKAILDSTAKDVKDLKLAFHCVTNENTARQISALISERDFVWNQYKTMELDLSEKLNSKKVEIELANEKIRSLLKEMEQLRSSNCEKDNVIQRLKSDVDELEAATVKKAEQIESLQMAINDSVTPSLRGCTITSRIRNKNNVNDKRNGVVKTETNSSVRHEKGMRSSKRKAVESSRAISETPKLFSSSFKVPKLKNPSPRVN